MERKVRRTKKEIVDCIRRALQFGAKTLHETGKVRIGDVQKKYGIKHYGIRHVDFVDLIHTGFSDVIATEIAEDRYRDSLESGIEKGCPGGNRTTQQIKKAIFDGIMKAANIMEQTGDTPMKAINKEFCISSYDITKKDILNVVASGMDLAVAESIMENKYRASREAQHARNGKRCNTKNEPKPIEEPARPTIIMNREEPMAKVVPLKKEEPAVVQPTRSMTLAIIFKTVSDSDLVGELRSRGYEVTASKHVML